MAKMHNPWTDEEIGILSDNIDRTAAELHELIPTHSISSIYSKRQAIKHGWRPAYAPWTANEDQILRDGRMATALQLAENLPGRTIAAIRKRRDNLQLPLMAHPSEVDPTHIAQRPLIAKTCPKCGNLRPSGLFSYSSKQRRWTAECKHCVNNRTSANRSRRPEYHAERSRRYVEQCQAITLPRATRSGQELTDKDHQVLADPSLTGLAKAILLNRTYHSVTTQAIRNGYRTHRAIGDPERDIWIIDNPNAERAEEITQQLTEALEAAPLTPAEREALWAWKD